MWIGFNWLMYGLVAGFIENDYYRACSIKRNFLHQLNGFLLVDHCSMNFG